MPAKAVRHSLFLHLLILCLIAACLVSAVATVLFYNYRYQLASNLLAVGLTNAARSIAPLVIRSSERQQDRDRRQLFRVFAAYPAVRCVSFRHNGTAIAAWPAPTCRMMPGVDKLIALPIGRVPGRWQIDAHIDLARLRQDALTETVIFAGVITVIILLLFLSFAASFRFVVLAPLDRLKVAMTAAQPEKPVLARLIRDDEIGALVRVYNRLAAASRYYMRQLSRSRDALRERQRLLDETNRNLNDSVQYASNIQRALLADRQQMAERLGKTVVIWQPKDFVGGDFYWFKAIHGRQYLVFFDCTGHGVPGAFMTMIVISALEKIAVSATRPPEAGELLRQLHLAVCAILTGADTSGSSEDGLDGAVLAFSSDMSSVDFAAAAIDLYVVPEDGPADRLRGHRVSLGYGRADLAIPTSHQRCMIGGNSFVIASDGLITQIGAKTKRAFGSRRFAESLDSVTGNDPAKLIRQLARDLNQWQGGEERRDDVTVVAFRPASR